MRLFINTITLAAVITMILMSALAFSVVGYLLTLLTGIAYPI